MSTIKESIIIEPKLGSFTTLTQSSGNICIYFTFQKESKISSPAIQKNSIYQWNDSLKFLYDQDIFSNNKDIFILVEARHYILSESYKFIGRNVYNLSKIYDSNQHLVTIDIYDAKSNRVGYLEVQFSISRPNTSPSENLIKFSAKADKVTGTFVFTPLYLKVEESLGNTGRMNPFLSLQYDDQAYKTTSSTWADKVYNFNNDILSFDLIKDQTEVIVYALYTGNNDNVDLGQAKLNLASVSATAKESMRYSLVFKNQEKEVATLTYSIEFVSDIFPSPPKVYPVVSLEPKQIKGFKVKFQNKSNKAKTYAVFSPDGNIVKVITPEVKIEDGASGDIIFSTTLPLNIDYCLARIDIWNKERNEIEESLLVRLKKKI